jgi:CHASE3 domain sensor protein
MSEENIYECEIRILKKNLATGENYYGWKVVPVREAIENKISKEDVRCKGCHGRIKLLVFPQPNRHSLLVLRNSTTTVEAIFGRSADKEMAQRERLDAPIEGPLRRRVTGGLIVAILLTVSLGFWLLPSTRRAEQDAYWVSHTYELMATIQRTSRHVLEAETSARAFALSGQEPLLVPYQTARETIYQDEDALRHLTADNLSQQRRLEVLDPQVRTALEFAESIIAKRRKPGAYPRGSDALEIERLVIAVAVTTRGMHAEETRLLSQRTQRAAAGQGVTRIIAIVGVFLDVGLWVVAVSSSRQISLPQVVDFAGN